jgi:hypothetical protein
MPALIAPFNIHFYTVTDHDAWCCIAFALFNAKSKISFFGFMLLLPSEVITSTKILNATVTQFAMLGFFEPL